MNRLRFPMVAVPVITAEEYRLLRDLIANRIGIVFGEDTRFLLERRLGERLTTLRLRSFTEYYQFLRFDSQSASEWDCVMDLLTTHETYFFRENFQLRAFRDEVLPLLWRQASGRKRLSLWSAGCSTGEEAYSIAMLVLESGLVAPEDVRIVGTDLSRRCIAVAREGLYGAASFRVIETSLREKYFTKGAKGYQVSDQLRSMCHFAQMNLLNADKARLLGRQDAIFCRNVFIYMDGHARKRVIDMFHGRLYPGGVLLLGHSESLLNVSTAFELLHLKEDLVYRKPLLSLREPPSLESREQSTAPDSTSRRG